MMWELFENIIRKVTSSSEPLRFDAWKFLYEKNKEWLFPFFPECGRITVGVGDNLEGEELKSFQEDTFVKSFATLLLEKEMSCEALDLARSLIEFEPALLTQNKLTKPIGKSDAAHIFCCAGIYNPAFVEDVLKISVGTKAKKVFGRFLKHLNVKNAAKDVESFRKAIEETRNTITTGDEKIVLSINPIDFALASTHTENWRSCYEIKTGDHRMGTISSMLDGVTIIAYAYKKTKFEPLSESQQPVKVWRQWIYLNPKEGQAIFAKHYPKNIPEFELVVRKLVGNLLAKYNNIPAEWEVFKCKYTDYSIATEGSGGYDKDTLETVIEMTGKKPHKQETIFYGEVVPCLGCGFGLAEEYYFVCEGCAPKEEKSQPVCQACGRVLGDEEYELTYDSQIVCKDCYIGSCKVCQYCGNVSIEDEMFDCGTQIGEGEGVWFAHTWHCEECTDKITHCDCCGKEVDAYKDFLTFKHLLTEDSKHVVETVCEECINKKGFFRDKFNVFEHKSKEMVFNG